MYDKEEVVYQDAHLYEAVGFRDFEDFSDSISWDDVKVTLKAFVDSIPKNYFTGKYATLYYRSKDKQRGNALSRFALQRVANAMDRADFTLNTFAFKRVLKPRGKRVAAFCKQHDFDEYKRGVRITAFVFYSIKADLTGIDGATFVEDCISRWGYGQALGLLKDGTPITELVKFMDDDIDADLLRATLSI